MQQLQITTRTVDGVHYVALDGELDLTDAKRVERTLVEVAGSTVVLDIGGLRFVDAAGLGAIVAARALVLAEGNHLVVRGAQPQLRRVFRLAGLLHLLE